MHRKASLLLAATALLVLALPAQAQWKWKDANGKIQYSDMPPPAGTPAANILQRPAGAPPIQVVVLQDGKPVNQAAAAASAPASAAQSKAELEAQAKKKQEQADQQAKQKAEDARIAAQKRENCARARENLATLDSGVPLRSGAGGDFMSDERRAAEQQRSRTIISTDCGG